MGPYEELIKSTVDTVTWPAEPLRMEQVDVAAIGRLAS